MSYKKGDLVKISYSIEVWGDRSNAPLNFITEVIMPDVYSNSIWVKIKGLNGDPIDWPYYLMHKVKNKSLRFLYEMNGPYIDE